MKWRAATLLLLIGATPAFAGPAKVAEHYGNIQYTGTDGVTRILTTNGNNGEPVLSPDGHTVAFIHVDAKGTGDDDHFTSLWIADGLTGRVRRLIGPHANDEPKLNFAAFEKPIFSLDGGFIYVSADAWVTSSAVHQVSIATGQEHFVIDGWLNAVVRTGPWRGYLLVGRHQYHPAPAFGSYNPVYVVQPDTKQSFIVPGSDKDDGDPSQQRWLASHHWEAW